MVRWASLIVVATVALAAVATAVSATGDVRATFTSAIPKNKSGGDELTIAWRLRDRGGRPVSLKRVFVKIVCPTRTDFTTTYARLVAPGAYRASAIVPPGGIGTISIGTKNGPIPITNPFHR